MLRVVRNDDRVALDPGQRLPGRGAYVHHDAECMEAAVKKGGLARTLRCKVDRLLVERLLTDDAARASARGRQAAQDKGHGVHGQTEIPKESKDS